MKFIKPEKYIIERAKNTCARCYKDKIVSLIFWDILKKVFYYLRNKKYNLILEIGSGYGFLLPSLCGISEKVIGSDLKDNLKTYENSTLNLFTKQNSNLEIKEIDARYISKVINEESCDVIIAINVLEHILEYKMVIDEIVKCLKPKGILICVLPTENILYKLGRKIIGYIYEGYTGEYHKGFIYNQWQLYLSENLFEIKKWFSPFFIPLFFYGVYEKRK